MARPVSLIEHLTMVPGIVEELRGQIVPSMQQRGEGLPVTTSDSSSVAPLRVVPLDEADELWAVLWEMTDMVLERCGLEAIGGVQVQAELQAMRARQNRAVHAGVLVVRGYGSSERGWVAVYTYELVRWLIDRAWLLSLNFPVPVDELIERIRRLQQLTGYRVARAYRQRACEACKRRTVRVVWNEATGGADWWCDTCESMRPVRREDLR